MVNETLRTGEGPGGERGAAQARVLVGIKRQDWHAQSEAALKLGRKLASRGEIAYCVVSGDGRSTAVPRRRPARAPAGAESFALGESARR